MLALFAAGAVAQGLVYPLLDGVSRASGIRLLPFEWLTLGAVAAAHLLVLRGVDRRRWSDVGLGSRQARARLLVLGAVAGALAIGVPVLALLGTGWLRVVASPAGAGWLSGAASALFALAPAALMEELLVRGYAFTVLREGVGTPWALALSSVVFGLLHLLNPGVSVVSVAMVTLAGVFLGAIVVATGSVWAAFTAHLAWNWTLSGLVHAAVSGLPFATPGYRVVDAGPDWLTGGPWGPEGGLAAGAGMLAALGGLTLRHRTTLRRGALAAGAPTHA